MRPPSQRSRKGSAPQAGHDRGRPPSLRNHGRHPRCPSACWRRAGKLAGQFRSHVFRAGGKSRVAGAADAPDGARAAGEGTRRFGGTMQALVAVVELGSERDAASIGEHLRREGEAAVTFAVRRPKQERTTWLCLRGTPILHARDRPRSAGSTSASCTASSSIRFWASAPRPWPSSRT